MRLSKGLDLFIQARTAEGVKDSTLRWYRQRLGRFVSWAGDADLESVDVWTIRRFLTSLRGQERRYEDHPYKEPTNGGLSPSTIRGYGRALRQFFKFLAAEGLTETSLMDGVKLPKKGKRAPKGITLEDLQKLLEAAEDSRCPERDRALLLFLADTGCRVGGLVGLTLADLHVGQGWAMVTEKFDKSRPVFFSAVTAEALRDWLEVRLEWDIAGDWVFLSHHGGGQLTVYGINQLLTRLKERGKAEGKCNPHAFRHGFAIQYVMNGGDLATLADLMGHESVQTTKDHYAMVKRDELRRKHNEFSAVATMAREGKL